MLYFCHVNCIYISCSLTVFYNKEWWWWWWWWWGTWCLGEHVCLSAWV